jgi:hypothetical protein
MNSLLIESNRVIAESRIRKPRASDGKTDSIHTETENNAQWSTTIDSGIELRPGDTITMEACALNLNGAGSADFMQFNGSVDTPDANGDLRTDNSVEIEFAFYVTNNQEFNLPLPAGNHTIEINTVLQGEFGAPCFDGRHLYYPVFNPNFTGTTFHADNQLDDPQADHFIIQKSAAVNGPSTNMQIQGGMYWVTTNTAMYNKVIPGTQGAAPGGSYPQYFESQSEAAAYCTWCCITGNLSCPGMQFGQNDGPPLPLDSAPYYDNDAQTSGTLNINIQNNEGGTYTNSGFFANGTNGAANPLVIQNGFIRVRPVAPLSTAPLTTNDNICGLYAQYRLTPQVYSYPSNKDSTSFKGSHFNSKPNGRRLYEPMRAFDSSDNLNNWCRGPFYDPVFNRLSDLIDAGDPAMQNMRNFHLFDRIPSYWKMKTQKVRIDLQTGNITPSRVSEIMTETLKERHGNASFPDEEFWPQQIFKPLPLNERSTGEKKLMGIEAIGGISSRVYSTFPTQAGAQLFQGRLAITNPQIYGPSGIYAEVGWSCKTSEDAVWVPNSDTVSEPTLPPTYPENSDGKNYNVNQAKLMYWSLQLCGNPYQWSAVTDLLPLIMYRPFIDSDVTAGFDYTLQSVYTGTTNQLPLSPGIVTNKRSAQQGNPDVTVKIGEYGEYPCMMNTPSSSQTLYNARPYEGLWWIVEGTPKSVTAGSDNSGPWRLQNRPIGQWYNVSGAQQPYRTLNLQTKELIVTNIIFDGQLTNRYMNRHATLLEEHNSGAALDSQSPSYFDNTILAWTIGRLDDQKTFPHTYVTTEYKKEMANTNAQEGIAQYLPNIFQSNKLFFNNMPQLGTDPSAGKADISNILTMSNRQVPLPPDGSTTQGSYFLNPTKTGLYRDDFSYTTQDNPNSIYVDFAGLPTYRDNMFGLPTYSFFDTEFQYETNATTTNGFKRISQRKIYGHRFLPQGGPVEYSAWNAYTEKIPTGWGPSTASRWTTKPATLSFAKFQDIWNTAASLNGGKGCGWIPVFNKESGKPAGFGDIPFLAVITTTSDNDNQKDIPLPEEGEYFFLGSPSLSQNDLHLPVSTQQTNKEKYEPQFVGVSDNDAGQLAAPYSPQLYNPPSVVVWILNQIGENSYWAPSMYVGANDPAILFDNTFNRFTYTKLHTDAFKGNGKFQRGSAGANTDPDTSVIRCSSNPSAVSRRDTLTHGYIGLLDQTDSSSRGQDNLENIFGNFVWDYVNPGGVLRSGAHVGGVIQNPQHLSPLYGTQWETKYMSAPGAQDTISGPTKGPDQQFANVDYRVPSSMMPYAYIQAESVPYPSISTQCGVSITGLGIPVYKSSKIIELKSTDFELYKNTLLSKCGYVLGQFLPLTGTVQSYLDHTKFNANCLPTSDAGLAFLNLVKPPTTQGAISTSLQPALVSGFGTTDIIPPITSPVDQNFPFYKPGMLIAKGSTVGISESMFALRLPTKLTFPYLVLRSNIATPCGAQYIGGENGQQLLPAISYLMTNYATNDYFYSQRSDLVFTVNRPYVLTKITTSIHFPNGRVADSVLDENSAVIYRIDFAQDTEAPREEEERDKQYEKEFALAGQRR